MRHQRNWIGLQLQCTCMSKRFVFEVFYCSLYLRDFSLVLASSIANLNGTINNPSFLEKLIVLFASNGYTQVLFPHEERQTILMTETATKNVPCLFLPSTCQGTGPVTACDWVESKESAAYLITQGMGIMQWNKTEFIVHFGVKPQFRPVQASKKSMVEIKHAELYHSSHAFFLLLALPWNWIGSNSDLHF